MVLRTSSTRSQFLHLPAGLHVLQFSTLAPSAFNVSIFCDKECVLGDELSVFKQLGLTSVRLQAHAVQTMQALAVIVTEPDRIADEAITHLVSTLVTQCGLVPAQLDCFWEALLWGLKFSLADIWTLASDDQPTIDGCLHECIYVCVH